MKLQKVINFLAFWLFGLLVNNVVKANERGESNKCRMNYFSDRLTSLEDEVYKMEDDGEAMGLAIGEAIALDQATEDFQEKVIPMLEKSYKEGVTEFRVSMLEDKYFIIHPHGKDGETIDVKWGEMNLERLIRE